MNDSPPVNEAVKEFVILIGILGFVMFGIAGSVVSAATSWPYGLAVFVVGSLIWPSMMLYRYLTNADTEEEDT